MGTELEPMWDGRKSLHYRHTAESLEKRLEHAGNLEKALIAVLETVVSAIHAQTGTLWFYDRFDDGRIRPRAGFGGGDLTGFSLLPGEGIAGQVIQSGRAVLITECQKDPRWAGKADAKTGSQTESMLCVPLSAEELTFGSIQLINKTDDLVFDEKDLRFTERLAEAAAELLCRLGFLETYLAAVHVGRSGDGREVSFLQVVSAASDREMEYQLRRVEAFAALRASEQEAVLELTKELRSLFGHRGPGAPASRRRGS